MARRRMIAPEIWESEDFSKLNNLSKIVFIGLISLADDEGRGIANPNLIKSKLFPYTSSKRDTDIKKSLQEVATHMSVIFYKADNGKQYYTLTSWSKWQAVPKPYPSDIPEYQEEFEILYREQSQFDNGSVMVQNQFGNGSVMVQPKRKEKKIKEKESKRNIYTDRFEEFWDVYPRKTGKGKAFEIFNRLNPDDVLLQKMIDVINAMEKTRQWQENNGQFIPNPDTWLRQRRWEDTPEAPTTSVQAPKNAFNNYTQKVYSQDEIDDIIRRKKAQEASTAANNSNANIRDLVKELG